jgi:hypothetical protein
MGGAVMPRTYADTFPFEGAQASAVDVSRTITAYSPYSIQTALENGCKTVREVMFFLSKREYEKKQAMRHGSRRGNQATRRICPRVCA